MEEGDEEIPLHRAINKEESKLYVQSLDKYSVTWRQISKDGTMNAMELAITAEETSRDKTDSRC